MQIATRDLRPSTLRAVKVLPVDVDWQLSHDGHDDVDCVMAVRVGSRDARTQTTKGIVASSTGERCACLHKQTNERASSEASGRHLLAPAANWAPEYANAGRDAN